MKRGDVVRTFAEFLALPAGSSVTGIEGGEYARGKEPDQWPSGGEFSWLPALVRVVGPVEPEWLEAAARAAREALPDAATLIESWEQKSEAGKNYYRLMAKAAVAAADKARGIVNSREEFDALPAGTAVVERDWSAPARFAIKHKNTIMTPAPSSYPCFVIEPRQ